ncbi:hypothetical protein COO60DRAFT_1641514 [Scenedesmus sp. NREL 46B-D3]|nr:hypothetical protein COO60DRAFT_1641514 [Scenedesmus sp. NREL 46B-D3]
MDDDDLLSSPAAAAARVDDYDDLYGQLYGGLQKMPAQLTSSSQHSSSSSSSSSSKQQDFEILVDEDTAPTPAPAAKAAAAAAGSTPAGGYPKPPAGPGAPPAGRASLGSAAAAGGAAHQMGGPHLQQQQQQQGPMPGMPGGGMGMEQQQRQGSLMSSLSGAASMGTQQQQQQQQQYSLPLGVMPGQAGVPGPRPPAVPYPGGAADAPGAMAGGVPPPRPPPGAPPPAAAAAAAEPASLNYIPMGMAGYQVRLLQDELLLLRCVTPTRPSLARRPGQPIKLPRQHNVDKEEYREFLNLGHGEIFSLELDRVTTGPWRAAGADISDFFNYGLTEKSWRQYQRVVAKYRAAYGVRSRIEVLAASGEADDLAGLPRELVAAVSMWRQQRPNKDEASGVQPQQQQVVPRARGREYKRHPDPSVVLTLVSSWPPPTPHTAAAAGDAPLDKDGDAADAPHESAAAAGDAADAGGQQQQQQQQPGGGPALGGDYDGPEAAELQLSGIPQLPPDTVGPPSPTPGMMPDDGAANASIDGAASEGLSGAGSGAMQQQGGQPALLQQQSTRSSSEAAGLEPPDGQEAAVAGGSALQGGGSSGGLRAAGSGELQQSEWGRLVAAGWTGWLAVAGWLQSVAKQPGRGVQIKLAARAAPAATAAVVQEQQQQPGDGDFMDEDFDQQQQQQQSPDGDGFTMTSNSSSCSLTMTLMTALGSSSSSSRACASACLGPCMLFNPAAVAAMAAGMGMGPMAAMGGMGGMGPAAGMGWGDGMGGMGGMMRAMGGMRGRVAWRAWDGAGLLLVVVVA